MGLKQAIRDEMKSSPRQAIPFRQFMEMALYHPTEGFYCKDVGTRFGKHGDFFTNVQVGTLFAKVLASAFQRVTFDVDERWALVEMGGGAGTLMAQIQAILRQSSSSPPVDCYLVEKRGRTKANDRDIHWVNEIEEIPSYSFAILYSNEFFDALPVHRLTWANGQIQEIYVQEDPSSGTFQEVLHPPSHDELLSNFSIPPTKHDGREWEVSLDRQDRYTDMVQWMKQGYIFTFDYGGTMEELFLREKGTVRYFQQHQLVPDAYHAPGDVDITAHVDFDQLMTWGERFGLSTFFFGSQARFMLDEGIVEFVKEEKQQSELKQLIHPDAMGEVFRVLIQKKLSTQ